ncbi:uncharacterized protein MAM_08313 [Metarhizium album ARSEF 1941]|uniref:feruloyl esterase n=1 Tax=Metarhizium album (strain ARSEF 1941) TaxID=1081103 RepID=A0A0B2WJH7_METAS|nr:uncharacterized protein MAM_08313 [Metarhizium album ARSEF 1941]KHN93834.1 hypothetical protein MAM_08313 [Metarhizium album ARSEF 1941]
MVSLVTSVFGTLLLSLVATPCAVPPDTTSSYSGGDTSGCGKTHVGQAIGLPIYRDIKSSGLRRSYSVHLPSDYDKGRRYPAILGFHGSGSVGLFFEVDTKLDEARFTRDKVMVYPNGLGGAWAGANYSKATVAQDLQFVWDLLADLRRNFCIDSARIYATGLSIGGGFVDTIACNSSVGGEFAAMAPASGSFYTDNEDNHHLCQPARVPMPILEFHGGADADVKYGGGQGEGGTEPAIPSWYVRQLAQIKAISSADSWWQTVKVGLVGSPERMRHAPSSRGPVCRRRPSSKLDVPGTGGSGAALQDR